MYSGNVGTVYIACGSNVTRPEASSKYKLIVYFFG